ncbi:hypothetical protein [Spirochaeta cellobiosiphila]|uniref:hypothetical protein n=1 Tax=Spirochaeta cellobiosiphila TaxID=504483 RepID=UPI0004283B3F|nr:hypothetical protein [Spirochaeta cellobiosiphila]
MKKILSSLIIVALLMSCTDATEEPERFYFTDKEEPHEIASIGYDVEYVKSPDDYNTDYHLKAVSDFIQVSIYDSKTYKNYMLTGSVSLSVYSLNSDGSKNYIVEKETVSNKSGSIIVLLGDHRDVYLEFNGYTWYGFKVIDSRIEEKYGYLTVSDDYLKDFIDISPSGHYSSYKDLYLKTTPSNAYVAYNNDGHEFDDDNYYYIVGYDNFFSDDSGKVRNIIDSFHNEMYFRAYIFNSTTKVVTRTFDFDNITTFLTDIDDFKVGKKAEIIGSFMSYTGGSDRSGKMGFLEDGIFKFTLTKANSGWFHYTFIKNGKYSDPVSIEYNQEIKLNVTPDDLVSFSIKQGSKWGTGTAYTLNLELTE